MASWDLATAGARHLYITDASDLTVTTFTNDTIAYTSPTDSGIGSEPAGGAKLNGCLAELYFNQAEYLDLDVTANRRKFNTASLKPTSLGADGSLPTGTAPILYHRVADGAAASTFATNLGTGGNFTITGTLDLASSCPSD